MMEPEIVLCDESDYDPRSPLNNDRFWGGRSADKAVVAA
jgi:hypothetical protein